LQVHHSGRIRIRWILAACFSTQRVKLRAKRKNRIVNKFQKSRYPSEEGYCESRSLSTSRRQQMEQVNIRMAKRF
jgi:hypothetical protein